MSIVNRSLDSARRGAIDLRTAPASSGAAGRANQATFRAFALSPATTLHVDARVSEDYDAESALHPGSVRASRTTTSFGRSAAAAWAWCTKRKTRGWAGAMSEWPSINWIVRMSTPSTARSSPEPSKPECDAQADPKHGHDGFHQAA
jgi:hypothetical protein